MYRLWPMAVYIQIDFRRYSMQSFSHSIFQLSMMCLSNNCPIPIPLSSLCLPRSYVRWEAIALPCGQQWWSSAPRFVRLTRIRWGDMSTVPRSNGGKMFLNSIGMKFQFVYSIQVACKETCLQKLQLALWPFLAFGVCWHVQSCRFWAAGMRMVGITEWAYLLDGHVPLRILVSHLSY